MSKYIRYGKNCGSKIVYLKKTYTFTPDYCLIEHIVFVSIVKNVVKNEKFFLHQIYARYGKNVKKQNCSFQNDLQLWYRPFFNWSYIFCLLIKNIIKNTSEHEPQVLNASVALKDKK